MEVSQRVLACPQDSPTGRAGSEQGIWETGHNTVGRSLDFINPRGSLRRPGFELFQSLLRKLTVPWGTLPGSYFWEASYQHRPSASPSLPWDGGHRQPWDSLLYSASPYEPLWNGCFRSLLKEHLDIRLAAVFWHCQALGLTRERKGAVGGAPHLGLTTERLPYNSFHVTPSLLKNHTWLGSSFPS